MHSFSLDELRTGILDAIVTAMRAAAPASRALVPETIRLTARLVSTPGPGGGQRFRLWRYGDRGEPVQAILTWAIDGFWAVELAPAHAARG